MGKSIKIAPGIRVARRGRANEDWYIDIKHPRYEGGRRTSRRVGSDRGEAVGQATRLARQLATFGRESVRVSEVLDAYEKGHAQMLRDGTAAGYRSLIRKHLVPAFGRRVVDDLTAQHVFDWAKARLEALPDQDERDRAWPATRNALKLLQSAIRWYWDHHEREDSCPAEKVRYGIVRIQGRYGVRARKRPVIEVAHGRALLQAADGAEPALHTVLLLGFCVGLRLGEALALRWVHVHLDGGFAYVRETRNGKGVLGPVKTDTARRTVRLPEALVAHLRALPRHGDFVLSPRRGAFPSQRKLARAFDRIRGAVAEQGYPTDVTIHSARHTWVSLAYAEGESDEFVRNQVGHASSGFTRSQYAHLLDDPERDVEWAGRIVH